jgi:PBP1b-binding outer membrane lipoprotein LpoB
MRISAILLLALLLSGCIDRGVVPYTAAEVDAINARTECKRLARNSVEIARCDTR